MRATLAALLLAASALPAAAKPVRIRPAPADPYLWLEAVSSPRAMAWVRAHNARSESVLEADPRYAKNFAEALAIAGAQDRIPQPSFTHGRIFNFWQDPEHLRGLWRETSLDDYRAPRPQWTTVLDIDALNRKEGKSWVFKGADCLQPEERRCLISLSNGGEDAVEIREFDLDANRWVADGFHLPRGKHRTAWEDKDTLLIATDWTPEAVTTSGYPFIIKRLRRGQPLSAATEVFRGTKDDGGYGVSPTVLRDGQDRTLAVIDRPLDTFRSETYVLTPAGPKRIGMPAKVHVADLVDGRAIFQLDEAWGALPAGTEAWAPREAVLETPEALKPKAAWTPTSRQALSEEGSTRTRLVLSVLDDVKGRALSLKPTADGWSATPLNLPDDATLSIAASDSKSDRVFIKSDSFLTPDSLWLVDAADGELAQVKTLPPKFDASGDVVEQFEAASSDGTKVPYFVVHRRDMPLDGTTPTLMTAYGGFQVANTPYYSGATGKLWLEKGGAYVLANIRGGGEFGPRWHEAALTTHRQLAYDDFAAVAKDLAVRKITTPRRLGIQGGSNGGLLMGVEFTQHPELWNAVVIDVPLLDMIRIGKIAAGASWQGEYGDVNADPKVMDFWMKVSPYQNLHADVRYPEPFIFTTTRDDRVGPQHARKFAARMEEMRLPFLYYENTEGGHGTGADIRQSAKTSALTFTYLQRKLMD